jgi:hypothetical protein
LISQLRETSSKSGVAQVDCVIFVEPLVEDLRLLGYECTALALGWVKAKNGHRRAARTARSAIEADAPSAPLLVCDYEWDGE